MEPIENTALSDRTEAADANGRTTQDLLIWQMLRKYWGTALIATVVTIVATVFFTLGQTKIYEAHATVLFDPTPPRPLGSRVESVVDMGSGSFWNNQEFYETQYNIIKSRRVALTVVTELGLQNDGAFLDNLPPGEQPAVNRTKTPELAAEELRKRLSVEPIKDSRMASVKLRDANPERAQRILNVLLETYVDQNLEEAMASTSSATDWLKSQLDALKTDLEASELELHQYKKENDIMSVAFDDQSSMLAEEMSQINAELSRVRAAQLEASARSSVLNSAPSDDPTLIQANELLQSPLMVTLRSQYAEAVRERDAQIASGKGKHHPEVAAAQSRVDAAKEAILKEIKNVKRAVNREAAKVARHAGGLKGMLEEAKKRAHEHNLKEIEYRRLRRAKDNTEKLYELVLERTKETDLAQMLRINNVSIVDHPLVPTAAISPRVPVNLSVGVLLGLLLGAAMAIGRGLMDRTLKLPEDIEHDLGQTLLGVLPKMNRQADKKEEKRRRRGRIQPSANLELVVHEDPTSSIAEAARAVRTNLMFMAPDTPYERLLVTSAGPSEGKTTVACCVAIAMAQAGQRVLLIDCDLRRPRVRRIFHAPSELGVTTVLLEDNLQEAVFESEIPNLSILPSGPVPPNPAELFHTDRFKSLIEEASRHYDRVIIDSPPVVAVTDPAILSTLVDGTLLVVQAHQTRKDVARHALRSLQAVGGHLAGVVLNSVDFSRSEYKYSYYYYQREGDYGAEATRAAAERPRPSNRPSLRD
ncbi:MAG: polysaccharide biosynthesis tyrosine autokinase [Polyangiaceae bacterium]